jgi:hypothetical protein
MQKRFSFFLRVGAGCGLAALAGLAQATTLTSVSGNVGNTTWQNIGDVSYTYADTNSDGLLDVGETVTFTVDVEKDFWGTHRFDAMKVWIDDGSANLYTSGFEWAYDPTYANMAWFNKLGDPYSYKPWTDGAKSFSFSYTFASEGTFGLSFSVMCSRDLSDLSGPADDNPIAADWDAWTKDIHKTKPWLQGEDKNYQLTVTAVPEPETYAMLMAGLGILGAVARRRRQQA